jgi:hypothetical protein
MRYDDYLAAWKGEIPKVPTGDPIPAPPRTAPKVPKPPATSAPTKVKPTKRAVMSYLKGKGWKESGTTKVKYTHTGQVYGGGSSITEGVIVRELDSESLIIAYRAGSLDTSQAINKLALLRGHLEDAGFEIIDGTSPYNFTIKVPAVWGESGPVRVLGSVEHGEADRIISSYLRTRRPNSYNALKRTVERQFSYVGEPKSRLKGIMHVSEDMVDPHYITRPESAGVLAYYRPGMQQLYLGDQAMLENFTRRSIDMQYGNWFSRCSLHHATEELSTYQGLSDTFAHEFGHFIDDILTPGSRRDMMKVICKDMGLDESQQGIFIRSLYGNVDLKKTNPDIARIVAKFVSRYGSTNIAEFFAEVWAEYSQAGPSARKHIQKWGSMIQDILEAMK